MKSWVYNLKDIYYCNILESHQIITLIFSHFQFFLKGAVQQTKYSRRHLAKYQNQAP